jgi:hypothetical protein
MLVAKLCQQEGYGLLQDELHLDHLVFYAVFLQSAYFCMQSDCFAIYFCLPSYFPQAQSARGWWALDMDVACYTSWHATLAVALGLPSLLLLCLGIPLLTASLLMHAWWKQQLHTPAVQVQYGFMYRRYK